MSSYAGLYIKDKEIFTYRNQVDQGMLDLFSADELLHVTGTEATTYGKGWYIDTLSAEEIEQLEVVVFVAPAQVLKDRLNVLGISQTLVKEVFEETLEDAIEHASTFAQRFPDVPVEDVLEKQLQELRSLDYDSWAQQLVAYISSKRTAQEAQSPYDQGPLKILSDADPRVLLRAILEHIDGEEVVTIDLTELVEGGWVDQDDSDSSIDKDWEVIGGAAIIITEGTYDAQVLKGAIEVLKPHLVPYIRFLDYSFRNEGSASVAVNTLKSFAAAGISNRIVAIFDNDSAAYEAVSALEGIKLPPYYTVIHYPDIALAEDYPTLGPQGNVTMNVNRLAGSIELYLGTDVLRDDAGNFIPVQWKGYMGKIKAYQGELLNKASIQKAFSEKLKLARADRKNVEGQDWSGLHAILDRLTETLSEL